MADKTKNYTKLNLKREVEDSAVKYGQSDMREARFANKELGLEQMGMSLQMLKSGQRSSFGHLHKVQEEAVVVLSGGGRIKLDDDIVELEQFDAVRIAPGVMQALEADDNGKEYVVIGAPKVDEADYENFQGWWD
jgi:uncharacterized cupin superfamily protein